MMELVSICLVRLPPNFGFLLALSLMLPQVLTLQAPFGAHTSQVFDVRASCAKSLA